MSTQVEFPTTDRPSRAALSRWIQRERAAWEKARSESEEALAALDEFESFVLECNDVS